MAAMAGESIGAPAPCARSSVAGAPSGPSKMKSIAMPAPPIPES